MPAVAAKSDQGVTVIVPSGASGARRVRISLAGTGLSHVVSAQVLYSDHPDDRRNSRLATSVSLPVSMIQDSGGPVVEFTLNPGGPGRGAGWEIARVTLQGAKPE